MYLDPSVQLLQSGPQEGPAPRRVFCQDGGRLPRSLPHVQRESEEYRPYRLFLSVPKLYQRVEGKFADQKGSMSVAVAFLILVHVSEHLPICSVTIKNITTSMYQRDNRPMISCVHTCMCCAYKDLAI